MAPHLCQAPLGRRGVYDVRAAVALEELVDERLVHDSSPPRLGHLLEYPVRAVVRLNVVARRLAAPVPASAEQMFAAYRAPAILHRLHRRGLHAYVDRARSRDIEMPLHEVQPHLHAAVVRAPHVLAGPSAMHPALVVLSKHGNAAKRSADPQVRTVVAAVCGAKLAAMPHDPPAIRNPPRVVVARARRHGVHVGCDLLPERYPQIQLVHFARKERQPAVVHSVAPPFAVDASLQKTGVELGESLCGRLAPLRETEPAARYLHPPAVPERQQLHRRGQNVLARRHDARRKAEAAQRVFAQHGADHAFRSVHGAERRRHRVGKPIRVALPLEHVAAERNPHSLAVLLDELRHVPAVAGLQRVRLQVGDHSRPFSGV